MMHATLCLLFGLILPQQVVPPDSVRVGDSLQVVDSILVQPPSPTDSVQAVAGQDAEALPPASPGSLEETPPGQEAPSDTTRADTTAADTTAADTTAADTTRQAVAAATDTVSAPPPTDEEAPIEELFEGLEREAERLRSGIERQFAQMRRTFTFTRIVMALLALAFAFLVVGFIVFLLEWWARWRPAQAGRIRKAIPLVRFTLWVVALWVIVGNLFGGSGLLLILAVLFVLGVAGFVLFQFLRDFVGGLVLLVEQPFQVGSRVAIGGQEGEVEKIGLRSFQLRTAAGEAVVVPNAEVLRQSVLSSTSDTPEDRVTVQLSFPSEVEVDRARQIAREAAFASPYIFVEKPVVIRLAEDGQAAHPTSLVVSAYVVDAQYAEALANDVLRLAHAAFAQEERRRTPDQRPAY